MPRGIPTIPLHMQLPCKPCMFTVRAPSTERGTSTTSMREATLAVPPPAVATLYAIVDMPFSPALPSFLIRCWVYP